MTPADVIILCDSLNTPPQIKRSVSVSLWNMRNGTPSDNRTWKQKIYVKWGIPMGKGAGRE